MGGRVSRISPMRFNPFQRSKETLERIPKVGYFSMDSNFIAKSKDLQAIFGDGPELDEAAIKRFLDSRNPMEWQRVLHDIKLDIVGDMQLVESGISLDFLCFINNVLKVSAEGAASPAHLDRTLTWVDEIDRIYPAIRIKINHEAMVRACRKNDIPVVSAFYKRGFRVHSALFWGSDNDDLLFENADINLELTRLEALANPAYLVAEAKYDHIDPIARSFHLLETVQEWSSTLIAFGNTLDLIAKMVKKFIWVMLNLCEGKAQVELFLGQDDGIDGLSLKGSTLLPRIYQGLQLSLEDFVTHDSCQQVIRESFYGNEGGDQLFDQGTLNYYLATSMQVAMTPWYSLWYILFKLKCSSKKRDQNEDIVQIPSGVNNYNSMNPPNYVSTEAKKSWPRKWASNLDVPFCRMTSHVGWYLLFVAWVLLSHMNFNSAITGVESLRADTYDYLACVWAVGFTLADIQVMIQLMRSVRLKHGSHLDLIKAKVKKSLSNAYIDYRIVSHLTLIAGYTIEFAGFKYKNDVSFRHCVDPEDQFSWVRTGNCLQGLAIVLIITQLLQLFRLHPTVGSVYIGMRRCIAIVASFMLAYLIITVAFALGLNFILCCELEECNDLNYTCQDGNFLMERKVIGAYCVNGTEASHIPCRDDCWTSFLEGQQPKECQMVPKIGAFEGFTNAADSPENQFRTMSKSMKTLFWSVFDPGHPEVVGCSIGVTRYFALSIWGVYNVIIVVILLNLLIALMNEAMESITENKLASWKYHRTHVWMDYCNNAIVLPAPLNLINLFVDIFICLCCNDCVDKYIPEVIKLDSSAKDDHTNRAQYQHLIRTLVSKYANDYLDAEEVDVSKDLIEDLRIEIRRYSEETNAMKKDLNVIVEMIQNLDAKLELNKTKKKGLFE
ncbi:short transient receptor potential channel 5-like [Tigriopus californicus]|uniref:short transient receptor potential channel 5-like n=1 Tax=Tigriopus californicus TaxID=6832 RepID=UPI0027DA8226|nr:short transient receptor potential channel 5-like [Tigriopus californicus]